MSLNKTQNLNDADRHFYQLRTEREFSEIEKKMAQIAWINGELFVPGIIVYPLEEIVYCCAALAGVSAVFEQGTLFVPADWVEKNFPVLREAISAIRKGAETVR